MSVGNSCEDNQLTRAFDTPREQNILDERREMQQTDAFQTTPPAIFMLNIDCFHEIFDWLELHDLITIGRTCRRLQQVAGIFYRSNYASKRIIAENGGGYTLYWHLNIFTPYIEKISISGNLKVYNFVGTNCKSIREIRLGNNLAEDAIECIKHVLKNVEVVEMNECFFKQEFYDFFLKYCGTLKNLSVKRSERIRNKAVIIGSDNDWLLRKYPLLEHIELTEVYKLQRNELKTFFELNPNVRTFSIDSVSLEGNQDSFMSSDAKLDKLAIEFSSQHVSKPVHCLLAQLHRQGFYKRLHVYSRACPQENLEQMFSMPYSSSLESLHLDISWQHTLQIDICLKNLKILRIDAAEKILNIETLPSKLPNLERIYFGEANTKEVWPFICASLKLKTVKISHLVFPDRIYSFREFPENLLMKMNEQRRKLAGARKVTIYIYDRLILVSKWAKRLTSLDLIELRRFESLEWNGLLNSYFRHNDV